MDYFKLEDTLEECYEDALDKTQVELSEDIVDLLDYLFKENQNRKAVKNVVLTLLLTKLVYPEQDIRYYQREMENGFSARSIDTHIVNKFLKKHDFPSMKESGWLTRTFESGSPYTLDYAPNITPKALKEKFLRLVDLIQKQDFDLKDGLLYILETYISERETQKISLTKPTELPIETIINVLRKHFNANYKTKGASKLPVLAIYSVYLCLIDELARYSELELDELQSQYSSDKSSGSIGDIQILDKNGNPFEGIEIKHLKKITVYDVRDSYKKFKNTQVKRYYILTTDESEATSEVLNEAKRIKVRHGCQVIVNGVFQSLKYYLRMLKDPNQFIDHYVELLLNDKELGYEHKEMWNTIIDTIE